MKRLFDMSRWTRAFQRSAQAQTTAYEVRQGAAPIVRTLCLSMVRNEQDIIEPALRHISGLVDLVVVLDNLSADHTRDILFDLARELGNIIVADRPDEGYNQAQMMTQLLHSVQPIVRADYIVFLDADDFPSAQTKDEFPAQLSKIPNGGVGLAPWVTWATNPRASDGIDPLELVQLRRREEPDQYYKAVLHAGGGTCDDLSVAQGNHSVCRSDQTELPIVVLDDLQSQHVPIRSAGQMRAKSVVGALADAERGNGDNQQEAFYWRALAEGYGDLQAITPEMASKEGLRYAVSEGAQTPAFEHATFPIANERKYSDGAAMDAKALIEAAPSGQTKVAYNVPPPPMSAKGDAGVKNAFDGAWHWDNLFLDQPPFEYLIGMLKPQSILDAGCGSGLYPSIYKHLGAPDVLGVDGIDQHATVLDPQGYRQIDFKNHSMRVGPLIWSCALKYWSIWSLKRQPQPLIQSRVMARRRSCFLWLSPDNREMAISTAVTWPMFWKPGQRGAGLRIWFWPLVYGPCRRCRGFAEIFFSCGRARRTLKQTML